MKSYEVRITDEALDDMDGIYDYIAEKLSAPENAANQYDRIIDAIYTLESVPDRYQIGDYPKAAELELRMMPVDNYCVFYCIKGQIVYVTDVMYGASDYAARLKGRDNNIL